MNESALTRAGALGVWRLPSGVVHVVVGEDAEVLAVAVEETRAEIALMAP